MSDSRLVTPGPAVGLTADTQPPRRVALTRCRRGMNRVRRARQSAVCRIARQSAARRIACAAAHVASVRLRAWSGLSQASRVDAARAPGSQATRVLTKAGDLVSQEMRQLLVYVSRGVRTPHGQRSDGVWVEWSERVWVEWSDGVCLRCRVSRGVGDFASQATRVSRGDSTPAGESRCRRCGGGRRPRPQT